MPNTFLCMGCGYKWNSKLSREEAEESGCPKCKSRRFIALLFEPDASYPLDGLLQTA